MWRASHSATEEDIKVDASKSSGVVIGSDTSDFNYPTEKHYAYKWVQWCYSIVKEAAPQLLNSEEFKTAYNKIVELCTKHKQELSDWRKYNSGVDRYKPDNIRIATKNQYPGEFLGRFHYQYYSYSPYSGPGHKRYTATDYTEAGNELSAAYVAIVNIIKPEIESYILRSTILLKLKGILVINVQPLNAMKRKLASYRMKLNGTRPILSQTLMRLPSFKRSLLLKIWRLYNHHT
jgi:hypothetical protein